MSTSLNGALMQSLKRSIMLLASFLFLKKLMNNRVLHGNFFAFDLASDSNSIVPFVPLLKLQLSSDHEMWIYLKVLSMMRRDLPIFR